MQVKDEKWIKAAMTTAHKKGTTSLNGKKLFPLYIILEIMSFEANQKNITYFTFTHYYIL